MIQVWFSHEKYPIQAPREAWSLSVDLFTDVYRKRSELLGKSVLILTTYKIIF